MKHLIILSLVLITIKSSIAQTKGTNQILAHNVTFQNIVEALLDSGFQIESIDKDFHILKTKPLSRLYEMELNVRVNKDSIAFLSGHISTGRFVYEIHQPYSEPYTGNNWFSHARPLVESFAWLDAFAKHIGTSVEYRKQ